VPKLIISMSLLLAVGATLTSCDRFTDARITNPCSTSVVVAFATQSSSGSTPNQVNWLDSASIAGASSALVPNVWPTVSAIGHPFTGLIRTTIGSKSVIVPVEVNTDVMDVSLPHSIC
jgi:hypothetical protein